MEKRIFIPTLCVPDVPTAKGNVAERKNFHSNKNLVSSPKWKNKFPLQPYVFQMYRQQKAMSLTGKFSRKTKFRFFAKMGKIIFVPSQCVPDVPAAEGHVAGPGQHQRRGVVQAPGQLAAEDAQVQ